jgi:hypothetical protein
VIETGTTATPPMVKVKVLSEFFGNPLPIIVNVVPPSGDPEFGETDVIARITFSLATPLAMRE